MDLCRLDNFENISEMRKKAVITQDNKQIGHIIDVVFDEQYQLHSFIIGGNFWEEFRESLGIIDDIDPVLPIEHILEIKRDKILIDLLENQLHHRFEEGVFPANSHTYSSMKRKIIHDDNNTKIGKICNMVFLPCGDVAFIIHCSQAKHLVPEGVINKWGLLLPINEIKHIEPENIYLKVQAENMARSLNEHVIKNEDVNNYLNSIHDKNTAQVKVVSRRNLGYFLH